MPGAGVFRLQEVVDDGRAALAEGDATRPAPCGHVPARQFQPIEIAGSPGRRDDGHHAAGRVRHADPGQPVAALVHGEAAEFLEQFVALRLPGNDGIDRAGHGVEPVDPEDARLGRPPGAEVGDQHGVAWLAAEFDRRAGQEHWPQLARRGQERALQGFDGRRQPGRYPGLFGGGDPVAPVVAGQARQGRLQQVGQVAVGVQHDARRAEERRALAHVVDQFVIGPLGAL